MARELIANDPLRQKYQQLEKSEGLSLSEVADRCGWMVKGKPDTSRVSRMLGLSGTDAARRIAYENAVALCDALHLDYWEAGV